MRKRAREQVLEKRKNSCTPPRRNLTGSWGKIDSAPAAALMGYRLPNTHSFQFDTLRLYEASDFESATGSTNDVCGTLFPQSPSTCMEINGFRTRSVVGEVKIVTHCFPQDASLVFFFLFIPPIVRSLIYHSSAERLAGRLFFGTTS